MKTSDLIGPTLDWAVAKCEGRVLREPVNATYADVEGLYVPFYLRDVVCAYRDNTCVSAVVKDIKVTRCGVDKGVGATAPSISFVDSDGRIARGSIGMFFVDSKEAELEAQRRMHGDTNDYSPSTDWAQGGPLIERERVKVFPNVGGTWSAQIRHTESHPLVSHPVLAGWTNSPGPTPLIAAMRCLVASRLGDEVEIPDELQGVT